MDDIEVQVVFEREDYNHQGMFEEKMGLRIGNRVQWYAYRSGLGGEDSEQAIHWEQMKRWLYSICESVHGGPDA